MAKNQKSGKKFTTSRKAEMAKRGKRHVYVAPPAPRPKAEVETGIVVKSLSEAAVAKATAIAKARMATWAS